MTSPVMEVVSTLKRDPRLAAVYGSASGVPFSGD